MPLCQFSKHRRDLVELRDVQDLRVRLVASMLLDEVVQVIFTSASNNDLVAFID
jgi:hypothetical protein